MTSIVEEYKVAKVRNTMILRDNKYDKVQGAQLDHRTRLKWKAQDALDEAESRQSTMERSEQPPAKGDGPARGAPARR